MLAPAQPLSIPLGGDACAYVSEDKTAPTIVEFQEPPNRFEMVSILCSSTSINSYHLHGTSAVFMKSVSNSRSILKHCDDTCTTLLQYIVFWLFAHA